MFSQNRFQLFLKFFHVVDNNKVPKRNSPQYRPDSKFKPLLDFANTMFERYYRPKQDVCVDETLVGTRGRTSMLQDIPSKHPKFGVKFWVPAESATGYIVRMSCYLDKKFQPVAAGTCQGTTVVMNLLRESSLLNNGYHVYCDNFFSSIDLARKLINKGTYFTGTIRSNRRLPQTIKNATVDPGTATFMRQREVLLTASRGERSRRPVRLISTAISADICRGVPEIVKKYNNNMGGVDGADMLMSYYSNNRKTVKVWGKMAFHIIQRMLLNSYVLYAQNTSEKMKNRLQFCQAVIEGLASRHFAGLPGRNLEVNPNGQRRRMNLVNLQGHLEKDCVVCSNRFLGIRKRSRTMCIKCKRGLHFKCKRRHTCSEE